MAMPSSNGDASNKSLRPLPFRRVNDPGNLKDVLKNAGEKTKAEWRSTWALADTMERDLRAMCKSEININDISDYSLRANLKRFIGRSDTISTANLLHMLRTGWKKQRASIIKILSEQTGRPEQAQEAINLAKQAQHKLDSALQAQRKALQRKIDAKSRQINVDNSQRPLPALQPNVQPVRQSHARQPLPSQQQALQYANEHRIELAPPSADLSVDVVATARQAMRNEEIRILSTVDLASLRTHAFMDANLYEQLVKLISESPDLSAISLLFGFCVQLNPHRTSAASVLRDYISTALLGSLLDAHETGMRRSSASADDILQDVSESIARKRWIAAQQAKTYGQEKRAQLVALHTEQYQNEATTQCDMRDPPVTAVPQLVADTSSVSSPDPLNDIEESAHIVQIWQLSLHEQQLQKKYFGLHYQTDVVHCLLCDAEGHMAKKCPKLNTEAQKVDREPHNESASTDSHSAAPDQPSSLGPVVAMLASTSMKKSCYNCGSGAHWGDECGALPGMIQDSADVQPSLVNKAAARPGSPSSFLWNQGDKGDLGTGPDGSNLFGDSLRSTHQ